MNSPNRFDYERQAHLLRRREISRLLSIAINGLGDALRRNHEQWLRRKRGVSLRPVNGTPA